MFALVWYKEFWVVRFLICVEIVGVSVLCWSLWESGSIFVAWICFHVCWCVETFRIFRDFSGVQELTTRGGEHRLWDL